MKKAPPKPTISQLLWLPLAAGAAVLLALALLLPKPEPPAAPAPTIIMPLPEVPYDSYPLVAHALGPVDGRELRAGLPGL